MAEPEIPLTREEFEKALEQLHREVEQAAENPGSYRSEECVRCHQCMFTTRSTDCFHCTYCDECNACSECTHCARCTNCHGSSYCIDSQNCNQSSYLIRSQNCFGSVFCFGCVGLVKKEFHILNKPYRRDVYFKMLEKLKKEFGLT